MVELVVIAKLGELHTAIHQAERIKMACTSCRQEQVRKAKKQNHGIAAEEDSCVGEENLMLYK